MMRAAGGVMLALGALLVLSRREGHWTSFELFLVLAAASVALLGVTMTGSAAAGDRAESWRSVLAVAGILLSPLALFQFLDWVGASTHHLLYDAAVLAVTGLLATACARRAQAPYLMLLAGLALLGAWMLVWIKVFPDPSAETVRWLLLGGGIAVLIVAALADLAGAIGAGDMLTAGSVGVVAAGILGVFVSAFSALALGFVTVGSDHPGEGLPARFGGHLSGSQTTGWDVYLLAVSLVLIVAGARARKRGPGYVGVLGILLFLLSTAAQLGRTSSGQGPSHSLIGWPLVLLLLGAAGLLAPLLRRRYD